MRCAQECPTLVQAATLCVRGFELGRAGRVNFGGRGRERGGEGGGRRVTWARGWGQANGWKGGELQRLEHVSGSIYSGKGGCNLLSSADDVPF